MLFGCSGLPEIASSRQVASPWLVVSAVSFLIIASVVSLSSLPFWLSCVPPPQMSASSSPDNQQYRLVLRCLLSGGDLSWSL